MQYRTAAFLLLVGFLFEPIVYLVVWRSIAASQGGAVGGYTAAAFTAYYIVWTLVRAMNLALTPYVWDWRIQRGRLSEFLVQPAHPFHRDLGWFAGTKILWIVLWIPVAIVLSLTFRPQISPTMFQVASFAIVIWTGFVVRFLVLYLMGLITFWTTRASAIFEIIIAAELMLSGRLVPLSVMPGWVQSVAAWLPFKWTFQYPIETLIGRLDNGDILVGMLIQLGWIAVLGVALGGAWRVAIKRYTAVGI
jgi:ABC-2 type transport system permease protein